jgi:hypothetical protein
MKMRDMRRIGRWKGRRGPRDKMGTKNRWKGEDNSVIMKLENVQEHRN